MPEPVLDIQAMLRQALEQHRAGRLGQAEALCRQVLRRTPDQPTALNLLAVLARQAGRTDAAIALLERAVARAPDYAEAHYNLGNALKDKGDAAGAVTAYDRAVALQPANAGWHNNRGAALLDGGDPAAAEKAFRRALVLDPAYAEAANNLGNALLQQDRLEPAIRAYRQAVATRPDFAGGLANLAGALLRAGRAVDALEPLEALGRVAPQHVRGAAYKAIALRELGRHGEADALEDTAILVGRAMPEPPAGFADRAAFHARLIADIRAHPTLTDHWNPGQRAARGGSVALHLLQHRTPAIAAFETMIRGAIDRFVAGLPDDPGHPFLCRKPRSYALDAWANILEEEGHQAAHIHNLGWLSGVYYPFVPDAIRADDPSKAGWIEFGRPGYDLPCRFEPRVHAITPETGLALMFPSYFWHRTIPFTGARERISIAFDLHVRE